MGGKHWQTRQARGYGEEWLRAREAFLRINPLCLGCQAIGVQARAQVVDHIVPHNGIKTLFWDSRNWQPLCFFHHDSVKARLENLYRDRKIKIESLRLDSSEAIKLTKRYRRVAFGVDGAPIEIE